MLSISANDIKLLILWVEVCDDLVHHEYYHADNCASHDIDGNILFFPVWTCLLLWGTLGFKDGLSDLRQLWFHLFFIWESRSNVTFFILIGKESWVTTSNYDSLIGWNHARCLIDVFLIWEVNLELSWCGSACDLIDIWSNIDSAYFLSYLWL